MVLHMRAWAASLRLSPPLLLKVLAAACVAGLLSACTTPGLRSHEMLNAVLWQQDSAEYRALSRQAYGLALERLDAALNEPDWTAALEQKSDFSHLPPAIILDLDETVLDNARYEARIITRLGQYSRESFAAWCQEGQVEAVPGAVDFLRAAEKRGVAIFYYSARVEPLRACTLKSLAGLGLPSATSDHLMLREPGGRGGKTQHRERVANRYRIVLLIGDSLEDFVAGSKASPERRRELVDRYAEWIGQRWILLPNATYGHWEATYYNFEYAMPREKMLQRKLEALTP